MCPACITTIALISAGGGSAGGLALSALARLGSRKRAGARGGKPESKEKSPPAK